MDLVDAVENIAKQCVCIYEQHAVVTVQDGRVLARSNKRVLRKELVNDTAPNPRVERIHVQILSLIEEACIAQEFRE
jgi:hypothetical protein